MAFNLDQGSFSIVDSQSKEVLLSNATFGLPSGRGPTSVDLLNVEDVIDEFSIGKKVIMAVNDRNSLRYTDHIKSRNPLAQRLFSYTLYKNCPALALGFGIKTPEYMRMRLMKSQLLKERQLFGGKPIENFKTLNGAAGTQPTLLNSTPSRICVNSLILTGKVGGTRRTTAWGGLCYNEFAAITTLDNSSIVGDFKNGLNLKHTIFTS